MSFLKKLIANVVREVVTDVAIPLLVEALTKKSKPGEFAMQTDRFVIRDHGPEVFQTKDGGVRITNADIHNLNVKGGLDHDSEADPKG